MTRAPTTACVKCGAPIDPSKLKVALRCLSCQDKRNAARVRLRDARKAAEQSVNEETRRRNFEAIPRLAAEHEAT